MTEYAKQNRFTAKYGIEVPINKKVIKYGAAKGWKSFIPISGFLGLSVLCSKKMGLSLLPRNLDELTNKRIGDLDRYLSLGIFTTITAATITSRWPSLLSMVLGHEKSLKPEMALLVMKALTLCAPREKRFGKKHVAFLCYNTLNGVLIAPYFLEYNETTTRAYLATIGVITFNLLFDKKNTSFCPYMVGLAAIIGSSIDSIDTGLASVIGITIITHYLLSPIFCPLKKVLVDAESKQDPGEEDLVSPLEACLVFCSEIFYLFKNLVATQDDYRKLTSN